MRQVLVFIESSRAFGRGLIRGISSYNAVHRTWSAVFQPHGADDPPPAWLKSWSGDGILARIGNEELAEAIRRLNKPAVDLKGIVPDLGIPYVGSDHRTVGRLAADHLWERGLRIFSFCGLPPASSRHYRDARFEWFSRHVAEKGGRLIAPPEDRPFRRASWQQQQDRLTEWLHALPKPIGMMTCQDDSAVQVIEACRRGDIRVPDEVAVVGVDDDELQCNLCCPPLTSIDPNAERIGHEAARLLDRMISGEPPPADPILIPPKGIVVRQSTELLAIDDPEVAQSLRLIRQHACDGLRVNELLERIPLSRGALEKRFRDLVGRTPKAEITRVQLERAKQLLADTDDPLDLIARKAGFRDARYLCDVFQRKVGVTPGSYRKSHQGDSMPVGGESQAITAHGR